MVLTPLAVHELAEAVLGCVCAALDTAAGQVDGQPGCPCRTCVVPGAVAWDSCDTACGNSDDGDDGGQLSVSILRLFPTAPFPVEDRNVMGSKGCLPPTTTAAELAVTLLRCAPTPDERGCPPSCDELGRSARIVHVDAITVFNALYCCLPGTGAGRRGRKFVMGQQRILGPEGGCVGVEQKAIVALPGCAPCPGEVFL